MTGAPPRPVALERTESRGAYTREDFQDSAPHLGKIDVIIRRKGDRMEVAREPLPELPPGLRDLLEAK
jgi:succinate dehydrogenase/fumarate reductase flavoprotein subunit